MVTVHRAGPFSAQSAEEEFDLFCPACAYNLYGIPPRRCPECGFRYDRAALLDFTAGERAAQLHARSAALVRGVYAIAFALSVFGWSFRVSPIGIFFAVMLTLCVAGLIRQACAYGDDWSWLEDMWWLLFRTLLLIWPATVLTLLPTIGTFIAVALLVDTVRLLRRASSPLPVLAESLPSAARRALRFYQAASMIVWIAAVGMLVVPHL